jgi:predicted transposase/invertase (TIGR01784 family)
LDEKGKRKIIETEYGIHYSADVERSVREMCNVSQGLIEKGEKRGLIEGEKRGRLEGKLEGKIEAYMDVGMSIDEIAERLGISVEEVQDIALSMEFLQ